MSTVFEALHRNGKRVAVKVLHPELAMNRRLRARFKREAYLANQVDHPDAVSIHDDDVSEDGLVFLVMEYLEGETLGRLLKRTGAPLPVGQVVAAALGVLDVLAAAHRNGVIHRDVKPDNVFLMRHERRFKLLDFGIARLRELPDLGSELTRSGATVGTPAFMAPEQARGHTAQVDAATDLWGVGATMFTLLTGRFVHHGENSNELLIAAATLPAGSLGSVADALPGELVAIVDRALAFEKSQRWPDAASMRSALSTLSTLNRSAFQDESWLPFAYEQNTQDESSGPPEPTSVLVEPESRGMGGAIARIGRRRVYAFATSAALAMGVAGWLMRPPAAPPLLSSHPVGAPRDLSTTEQPTATPPATSAVGGAAHAAEEADIVAARSDSTGPSASSSVVASPRPTTKHETPPTAAAMALPDHSSSSASVEAGGRAIPSVRFVPPADDTAPNARSEDPLDRR